MINPQNREATVRLYRWMEKREVVPQMTNEQACTFFEEAWKEIDEIIKACEGSDWVHDLAIGYYQALENRYKDAQRGETNNVTT